MAFTGIGTIQGRQIHLSKDIGLRDGERVRVTIDAIRESAVWGEGIMRSAGALADCPEFDAVFAQIQRSRKGG